jgi:Transglutaminase-like superfamily
LCAMCRSIGIPARLVSGYELYPASLAYHYWAEVWCEERGWSSFDFLAWMLSNGGRETAWRDIFAGQIDYRIKTEVLPRVFTGTSSVRLPSAWHMIMSRCGGAYESAFYDADSGGLVYCDTLEITDLDEDS